ncbi:MAG: hypothetical protein HDQ88_09485 [Clostridia bacterium]|nr:hypothetical protein [Clostridia bacterium]
MEEQCTPRTVQKCAEELVSASETQVPVQETWEICLPWGGLLYADELGVHLQKGSPPPDGVYDRLVIADGCLVNVRQSETVPIYTGSPCAPLPGDCTGSGSGGGGSGNLCNPSATPGNLYRCDLSGRPLVTVYIEGGSGITVTGNGTSTNPFIISGSGGSSSGGMYIRSGNDAIKLTGSGTYDDPYVINHKEGTQTTINGMTFDRYGHLIDTGSGSANKGVTGIIPGDGIDVDADPKTNIYTIKLAEPLNKREGIWLLGGYDVTLDKYNNIYDIKQNIDLGGEQTVSCGGYDITFNELGSATSIEKKQASAGGASSGSNFFFYWMANAVAHNYTGTFNLESDSQIAGTIFVPVVATVDDKDTFLGSRDSPNADVIIDDSLTCEVRIFGGHGGFVFWSYAVLGAGEHTLKFEWKGGSFDVANSVCLMLNSVTMAANLSAN